MPMIEVPNKHKLEELLMNSGRKLVVVAFTSKNCGPCRLTTAKLEVFHAVFKPNPEVDSKRNDLYSFLLDPPLALAQKTAEKTASSFPKTALMSNEMPDIAFIKIDVCKADEVVEQHEITGVPAFQFYRNNTLVYKFQGGNVDYLSSKVHELRF